MKNNFTSSKKPKIGFVALLLFFCVLWGNGAMGQTASANQDTFIWTGTTSTAWEEPTNWSILRATSTPGTDTYPGQTSGDAIGDIVFVNKNDTPNAMILASQTRTVFRLTISNQFGTEAGAIMTINSDATLTISSNGSNNLVLAGGSLINNGALIITTTGVGFASFPAFGINCSNPSVLPTIPREYTYSGNGTLSITLSAANFANAAAFATSGNSANANLANTTYKLVLNNPSITLNQSTALAIGAIRTIPATAALPVTPKLIISGTGLTLGTVSTPSIGSLIGVGNATNLTVDTGTVLTLNSATANVNSGIEISNSIAGTGDAITGTNRTRFTNNGTINIKGNTSANGIRVATFSAAGNPIVGITFVNNGLIDVNVNATLAPTANSTPAAFQIPNGFGTTNANALLTLTNNGIINLKNTSTAAGNGFAIWVTGAGERTKTTFNNNGTVNVNGTVNNVGQSISLTNNAIINSNSSFSSFAAIINSSAGSFNFTKAETISASFTVDISAAATAGSIYTDANLNSYTVGTTKVTGTGTSIGTSFNQTTTVPASGTLTFVSGTGDPTIAYSAVTVTTNALPSPTTNSGIINTGKGALRSLSIISGVSDASTGTIAPGGTDYGIAELNKVSSTPDGILKIQVAGNSAAGVDYDQLSNSFAASTLSLANLDLNISFLYTPASSVTIPIVTAIAITGNFATVTGLTPGWALDYSSPTVVNLVYTTGSATATTWNGLSDSVWTNVGNWTAGVPTLSSNVTIGASANQPVIGSNVNILSLTIDATASVTVNSGFNLSVADAITNNGALTIASNANLIQINNATNTGNITVNRNSNLLSRLDYTSWSSPVTNASQFLTTFSPATDLNRFYNYNETSNAYNEIALPGTIPFAAGTGYLIRMPNDHPTTATVWNGSFSGLPNNGTINKAITYNGAAFGYNMIGNPYPSAIDASAFIAANTANIESSLYFWRKINAASGSAYAVYNPMGATTASPSSAVPNGTIQVGQGFFVKAKSASSVNFTNAMRVANNSNQFFKTKAAQKDRVWLNLTTTPGVFSQALIGYTADATTAVDMYDAKYINDSPIALTSSINSQEYTIQGRPTFDATDVVALNFKTDAAGDYTIAIAQADGVFAAGQDVYLVDSKTGTETNLNTGSYTFAATAGVDNSRFSLKYQKTLSIDTQSFDENSISVYASNGTLYVNSKSANINNVTVYDVQGRLIAQKVNVKSTTAVINNLRASNQVLIVRIEGEDSSVVTKKLLN
jgi:hypothetical protein